MLAQHVSEQYPHLFSPLKIGTLTTANRLFVSAMVTNFCDMDGFATERYIAYHEEKAKGGWGLIITEDYAVTPDGRGFKTPGLWKDEQIAGHRELTRRVHQYQSRIFAQIYHCGRQTHPLMPYTRKPATASALNCPACLMDTRELTIPEIQEIVTQFADCASRAKAAGFDGVEIHGAHGYLIAQFMSWHANKRVDEYGGPLGNRMRFPLEIISAIKQTCGADFPVTFRISGEELVRDGRTIEDTVYIATLLEKAGIDGLHVSMGTYGAPDSIIPPAGSEPGRAIRYAEAVKQAVSIPVFAVNRISEPGMAENILRMGRADAVVMGRGSLADPHLPAKVMEGRLEDVRRCIGCMQGCVGNLHKLDGIACLVNPELGYEEKQECRPAREKKKVVVIGTKVQYHLILSPF